jgi:hypothetical protein
MCERIRVPPNAYLIFFYLFQGQINILTIYKEGKNNKNFGQQLYIFFYHGEKELFLLFKSLLKVKKR